MSNQNPPRGDPISAAIAQVVTELGTDVLASPARLRAALSDVLGPEARSQRAAIDAVVLAAEAGVPAALAERASDRVPDPVRDQLANRIAAQGITAELARTTVSTLATVIAPTESVASAGLGDSPGPLVAAPRRAGSVPPSSSASSGPSRASRSRARRLVPAVLTGALMAASALVSGGIVYAGTHPDSGRTMDAIRPVPAPTVTVIRSKTITKTRSLTKTRSVTKTGTRTVTATRTVVARSPGTAWSRPSPHQPPETTPPPQSTITPSRPPTDTYTPPPGGSGKKPSGRPGMFAPSPTARACVLCSGATGGTSQ